jgi:PKD domain
MRLRLLAVALVVAVFVPMQAAQAVISGTTGAVTKIAPPAGVTRADGQGSTTTMWAWDEQQGVTLASNVGVDITVPGTYESIGSLTGGSVPAGTVVDSHFFNSVRPNGAPISTLTASLSFPADILGVIVRRGSLINSNTLGAPETDYQVSSLQNGMDLGATTDGVTMTSQRSITIRSSNGGTADLQDELRVITRHDGAPVVSAGGPYAASEGGTATLSGSAVDPEGDPVSTSWSFVTTASPGTVCTTGSTNTLSPTVTCNDDALVTATLSAFDPFHSPVTSVANITFSNVAPSLSALTVPTGQIPLATPVNVSATFSDAGTHDTHTATVDWGDTTSSNATITETNGAGSLSATHTYTLRGHYTILVTLRDDNNGIATATATVDLNGPPTANAGGPYSGTEGVGKVLGGTASDPEAQPLTTTWTITPTASDPGTTCGSTGISTLTPTVTCNDNAVLSAQLAANDGVNPSTLAATTITINNTAPVIGTVTAPTGPVPVGGTVNVSAPFSDAGTHDTHTATVNWGDLLSTNAGITELLGSGTLSASHVYATAGLYTLTITLTDDNGGTNVKTVQVLVNTPPTVSAGGPYVGTEGSQMLLSATANDIDGDALTYSWTYTYTGDAGVVCSVTGAGTHASTLTLSCTDDAVVNATVAVSDGVNTPRSDTASLTVGNLMPVAGTLLQEPTAPPGSTVAISLPFSDPGTNDTHTASVAWGDTTTSAATVTGSLGAGTVTASHLYATDGNYSVTVTITDDNGAFASRTITVTSDTTPPVITGTIAPAPNGAGWDNSPVTVTWAVTDSLSPIASTTGCDPTTRSSDTPVAGTNYTCSATSRGGTSSNTVTVKLDQVAPSLSGAPATSANPNGWYNAPVTIHWTCSDALSGIAGSCPANTILSSEGAAVSASATVSDNADNSTNSASAPVKIDTHAPATAASTLPEWNNSSVTLTLTATDNLSGVDATKFIVDNGPLQTGTSVLLTDEGTHTVDFFSIDNAGNVEATHTAIVKVDKTAPSISVSAAPAPNAAGWNNTNAAVTFLCADSGSGLASCTPAQNVTTEGSAQVVSGTAADNAGNSASASHTLNIDKTPPTISGVVPTANVNGWYNAPVTLSWLCADTLSGVASCPAPHIFAVDGINQSRSGTATDIADNSTTVTRSGINVDQTAPVITASVAPAANTAGWNNSAVTVHFTCTDATSGIAAGACPADQTVSTQGVSTVSGSVDDRAGNTATTSVTVRVDTIAPGITGAQTPAANGAGWNNTEVTVSFTCTDSGSGIAANGCTAPVGVSEGANQSVTGTATDLAGNSATASVTGINVDETAPTLTGTPTTSPNANGWYSGPVTIHWTCSDALSGILGTCPPDSVISGEGVGLTTSESVSDVAGNSTTSSSAPVQIDRTAPSTSASSAPNWSNTSVTVTLSATDSLSGVAETHFVVDGGVLQTGTSVVLTTEGVHTVNYWSVDRAGNIESAHTTTVKIDLSAPSITVTQAPAANANGWNNTNVTVTFTCADLGSGLASCTTPQTVVAEGAGQNVSGTAFDNAGNSASASATVNIDKTAPTIAAVVPDANINGWYDQPVTVAWLCADALSGVASCPAPTTLTADGASQSVPGTAADAADNTHSATASGINIDQTPPTLTASAPATATGWYPGPVTVHWTCGDNLSGVTSCPPDEVVSSEGFTTLAETITDQAGNSATTDITIRIDETPPSILGSATPSPNGNGWTNTDVNVSFACTDNLSGVVSCSGPSTLHEGAGQSVTGNTTDVAGNHASTSVSGINVDKTAPTLSGAATTSANTNGWYNHAVTIHWTCGDALSGVDNSTCPGDAAITSEGVAQQLSRTVLDLAGNAKTSSSTPVKIDLTPPVTTASAVPTSFANTDVTITLSATDNLSGVNRTLYSVDGGSALIGTSVTLTTTGVHTLTYYSVDNADNTESLHTVTVRIDRNAPTITSAQTPSANGAGWNNTNVTVTFACSDDDSGIASCTTPQSVTTNGAAQAVSGSAVDNAGNTASATRSVSIDKVPPTITSSLSASANINGWFHVPVSASFACNDALSGLASCSPPVTFGQGGAQSTIGTATDVAGNSATANVGPISVDLTAPTITAAPDRAPDSGGVYDHAVTIHFTCTDALSGIASGACPADVVVAVAGVTTVTGSTTDRAGNTASTSASITVTVSSVANLRLLTLSGAAKAFATAGNARVTVAGTIADNSTNAKAMAVNGNARVTAQKILISGSGACSGCTNANTTPLPTSGSNVPDPLVGLVAPSTTGMPVYTDGAYHGPGKYTTKLSIPDNSVVTMASGIYVLQNGIEVSGNAVVNSAAGGVFLYVPGGGVTFAGNGVLTLSPLATGPYSGVLLFQHSSNSTTLTLSGNAATASFNGTLYTPGAPFTAAGNATTNVGEVIASTATVTGNGILNIG